MICEAGLPEVSLGIKPEDAGTQRIARLISPSRAAERILSERILDAQDAREIGVFNAVLPTNGFVGDAMAWCQRMAWHSPLVLALANRAVVGLGAAAGARLRVRGAAVPGAEQLCQGESAHRRCGWEVG